MTSAYYDQIIVGAGISGLYLLHAARRRRGGARDGHGKSLFVTRELTRVGLGPIVVDAHEVRLKAHRPTQKSDRRDALELCEGIRRGIYRTIVHVPPLEMSRLRETPSRRRHFVRSRTLATRSLSTPL
jgi:transposase